MVLFDAPPSIGHNLQRAIDAVAATEGASNTVTHHVYSHHNADHGAAASLFQAPDIALSYPWSHLSAGTSAGFATRDDVSVHQQYIADIDASAKEALAAVDPVPFYAHYWPNVWAGVKAHLDTVTERAAAPVIAKYTGVLAAADIEAFTTTTTFEIMQSLRLDKEPERSGAPRYLRWRPAAERDYFRGRGQAGVPLAIPART